MILEYPVLSPRGLLSVGLKQTWPGSFQLRRKNCEFRITLSHAAFPGVIMLRVSDDELLREPEAIVRGLVRKAWRLFWILDDRAIPQQGGSYINDGPIGARRGSSTKECKR